MNETQTKSNVRPTRKQKVILDYIEEYIAKNGYSPSYREIKADLNYKSLASVAQHVDNLIKRGHLTKRDYSARSIDLVESSVPAKLSTNEIQPAEEKWLIEKIEHAFVQVEGEASQLAESSLDHLYVLIGALKVLGLEAAAQSFSPRLNALKKRASTSV
jgi:hypothetical protein